MENLALYIVVALTILVITLILIATYIVCPTHFDMKNRRSYQIAFTWFFPVIGSLFTIFSNKQDYFAQKQARQPGKHPNISE